jgi:ubiquinone/menaquinone biosynthesis C-methylase UbiE
MAEAHRAYLPAAGRDWRLPFYDPLVALMGAGRTRRALIERAALQPHQRVLEIGCGTGTLLTQIALEDPTIDVVGLDPDPKALARARQKARRRHLSIRLDQGFADQTPYPDDSFDRVFSSFMFHHLPAHEKEPVLREVRRVLKPQGLFVMLDFAGREPGERGLMARHLHASHRLEENSEDRILALLRRAGFDDPRRIAREKLLFGQIRVNYFQAVSPAS